MKVFVLRKPGQKIITIKIASLVKDIRNNSCSAPGRPGELKHELRCIYASTLKKLLLRNDFNRTGTVRAFPFSRLNTGQSGPGHAGVHGRNFPRAIRQTGFAGNR